MALVVTRSDHGYYYWIIPCLLEVFQAYDDVQECTVSRIKIYVLVVDLTFSRKTTVIPENLSAGYISIFDVRTDCRSMLRDQRHRVDGSTDHTKYCDSWTEAGPISLSVSGHFLIAKNIPLPSRGRGLQQRITSS